jgi:hypothetical protein
MQRNLEFIPKNWNTPIQKKGVITGTGGKRHGTGVRTKNFKVYQPRFKLASIQQARPSGRAG